MNDEETRLQHVALMMERGPSAIERLSWNAVALAEERQRRLRLLVAAAGERSTWHRDRLHAAGLDAATVTEARLRALAPMTKTDLMEHFDDIVTDERVTLEVAEKHLEALDDPAAKGYLFDTLHVCASGGTSGRRGVFVWDWDGWAEAFLGMVRRVALRPLPGDPPQVMVSVAGGSPVHMSYAITRTFTNPDRVIVSVPATLPFDELIARVEEAKPHLLQGYPSMLHRLALEGSAGRLAIEPHAVAAGSEVLTDETRALLADTWGVPVDDLYATTDVGPVAASCEHGALHLCDDLVIVEVVDRDGEPVDDGIEGDHLLVTGLLNQAQPLLRYVLDDRVTISPDPCPCGSAHRVLRSVGGRSADVFDFGDATLHPVTLSSALASDRRVADWRVTRTPSGLGVEVVPLDGPDTLDVDVVGGRIRDALVRAGVTDIDVAVVAVDALDRPTSGKARRYVTS